MCVWAAEGLVAREILTYRAPLPAALSLASTSQRKCSAAARLIYNLSPSLSYSLLLPLSSATFFPSLRYGCRIYNFYILPITITFYMYLSPSFPLISLLFSLYIPLFSLSLPEQASIQPLPLSLTFLLLLHRLMKSGPVVLVRRQPSRSCCN